MSRRRGPYFQRGVVEVNEALCVSASVFGNRCATCMNEAAQACCEAGRVASTFIYLRDHESL